MKTSTTLKILALALLFVGTMMVVTPTASAQLAPQCNDASPASVSAKGVSGAGKMKPITGSENYQVKFDYIAPPQAASIVPVPVTIAATKGNAWTTVIVSPSVVYVPAFQPSQTGFTREIATTATVTFSKDAPAFAKETVTFTATAGPGSCVGGSTPSPSQVIIVADFYERYQARFEKTIFKAGQNSQVAIPTTLENFGNGDINVNFAIGEGTSKGLVLALPGQQIVASTISGGESNRLNVNIDVKTPFKNGYENRQDQLVIGITGNSADDTSIKLNPLQVSAVIQTQGVYVPGFDAVAMVGALLGAVLAVRRLR